jgi:uncharacterized membrane protein SpoIIM required for sporulation
MDLFLLIILIPFVFIASVMAFLITWIEYQRHKFKGRRLFMEAFKSALFAFVFLSVLSLFIVYALTNLISAK